MQFKIISARVLSIVRPITEGHNCDFTDVPMSVKEYEIILEEQGRSWGTQLWQLHLSSSSGQCGSGWCTASWGHYELRRVSDRGPATHLPVQEIMVELDPEHLPEYFECEAFSWSDYGGDEYYPSGSVSFNVELFKPTGRGHQKPLVWVFSGVSNLGKSTLAQHSGMKVYETDQAEELGDEMVCAQVIVIGGKYPHSIDGVRALFEKHELDVDLVPVTFG